jgi:hypothetical protein
MSTLKYEPIPQQTMESLNSVRERALKVGNTAIGKFIMSVIQLADARRQNIAIPDSDYGKQYSHCLGMICGDLYSNHFDDIELHTGLVDQKSLFHIMLNGLRHVFDVPYVGYYTDINMDMVVTLCCAYLDDLELKDS